MLKWMETCPKGHRFNRLLYKTCPFCKLKWGKRRNEEEVRAVYAGPPISETKGDEERTDKMPIAVVYAAPPFPKGEPYVKIRRREVPPILDVYNGPDIGPSEEVTIEPEGTETAQEESTSDEKESAAAETDDPKISSSEEGKKE